MTSSSDRPPPVRSGSLYARFIPREELQGFTTWMPSSLDPRAPEPPPDPGIERAVHEAALRTAHEAGIEVGREDGQRQGYAEGYRDGLAALEGFKQHHTQQMAAQVGALVGAFDAQFEALEAQMAQALADAATRLARAVVRAELATRPEAVAQLAQEAVGVLLAGTRQVRVLVNPEDEALVALGASEALAAREARLVPSASVSRGGCVVESELGRVDARIEQRWAQAAGLLGRPLAWDAPAPSSAREAAPAAARPEPRVEAPSGAAAHEDEPLMAGPGAMDSEFDLDLGGGAWDDGAGSAA